MLDEITERWCEYFETYEKDAVANAIQQYPKDTAGLTINYTQLSRADSELAQNLVEHPEKMLSKAEDAVSQLQVPHAEELDGIRMRVSSVPTKEVGISDIRKDQQGELITVRAQVSKATEVQPRYDAVAFSCVRCPSVTTVPVATDEIVAPKKCDGCDRAGPFEIVEADSVSRDHQIVELQPRPDDDAMNLQRSLEVHLYDDLVDCVEAGQRVKVTGILRTKNIEAGKRASARRPTFLDGLCVEKEEHDFDSYDTEREDEIIELSKAPNLKEKFIASFAPDILTGTRGDIHKLSIIYQLFGGVRHVLENGREKRSDINLLLIGAPGTGKSAYLSAADTLAPKSVKASGKGATAAGLTATATQPDFGDGWMLDAGALVMASGGIACIDEFDKMDDSARKSMHEAMEDQQIPINKAGINTTLTSKTSVLAAANPKDGSFNRFEPLAEQINLGDALISRFDLVFALEDTPDKETDREIAKHQYNVAQGDSTEPAIEPDLLREYIAYARQNINPQFSNKEAVDMLIDKYVGIRQTNTDGNGDNDGPIPVTARMNESLRRLAEAAARSELSEVVKPKHAKDAIELYELTIGDVGLTEDGDLDAAKAGGYSEPENRMERVETIKEVIEELDTDRRGATKKEIVDECKERGIAVRKTKHLLQRMRHEDGTIHQPETGRYRLV